MSGKSSIPPNYAADIRWVEDHYAELLREYENMWVAVVNGAVAAARPGLAGARRLAASKTGKNPDSIYAEFMCGESAVYGASQTVL